MSALSFEIPATKLAELNRWIDKQRQKNSHHGGAIGGRFAYIFAPTTLGLVIKVRDDLTKDELDLSDYENW